MTTVEDVDVHRAGAGFDRPEAGRDWTPESSSSVRRVHSWLRRLRELDRRRPVLWDALLTVLAVPVGVMPLIDGTWRMGAFDTDVSLPLLWGLSVGFVLPLLWRRRAPLAVLLVLTGVGVVNAWTGAELQVRLVALVVLYCVAVRMRPSAVVLAVVLVALPSWITAVRWMDGGLGSLLSPLVAFALVAAVGVAVRYRRDYTAALVERAHRLETEQEQRARLAAAAERARIAGEMHDILGHHLSVITGLADGGGYAARKQPERATQALDAIGTTSRQALGELRRLLDVLHGDAGLPDEATAPAALAPQPTLDDLDALLDRVRKAGLPVSCTVHGRPPTPEALGPGRQLTVYRVVQEALTNTLKHGGGDGVEAAVTLSYRADGGVRATITDTGGSTGEEPRAAEVTQHAGRGLGGMRDRAALYDGTLKAGRHSRPRGGWQVCLFLPPETDRGSHG